MRVVNVDKFNSLSRQNGWPSNIPSRRVAERIWSVSFDILSAPKLSVTLKIRTKDAYRLKRVQSSSSRWVILCQIVHQVPVVMSDMTHSMRGTNYIRRIDAKVL